MGGRARVGGAVVRPPASHQCGLGSNHPSVKAICGLSLSTSLVHSLSPWSFLPGTPVYLSPQKPIFTIPIQSGNRKMKNHLVDVLPLNRYSFIFTWQCTEIVNVPLVKAKVVKNISLWRDVTKLVPSGSKQCYCSHRKLITNENFRTHRHTHTQKILKWIEVRTKKTYGK